MRTLVLCAALLMGYGSALAAASHDVVKVSKKRGGARFRVRLNPEWGYQKVTIGVAAGSAGRYGRMTVKWADRKSVKSPTEVEYDLAYDGKRFKSGSTVTVISRWPSPSHTHHWGTNSFQLP